MEQTLRQTARRLRLGVLALHLYHAPRGFVRRCRKEGALNLWLARRGRRDMERSASNLPPLVSLKVAPWDIHFLTGEKFWYQTLFCAWSLMKSAGTGTTVVLLDDGTLTPARVETFRQVLPSVRAISRREIEDRLDTSLPAGQFPALRARRIEYPHLRKLTDVHAGTAGWKLVLDSDMLFHRRPDLLLEWLARPDRPLHMQDCVSSYGYSRKLMEQFAGAPVADLLNVGICGLDSSEIDWNRLEHWTRAMIEREGRSYYQEQALTAMLLAGRECTVAPQDDYLCKPDCDEVIDPKAVLHHYVASSKAWYFRFGWRRLMEGRS